MTKKKTNFFSSSPVSSSSSGELFFVLGKITRIHGLKGEIFVSLMFVEKQLPLMITNQIVQIKKESDSLLCFKTEIQEARLHKKGMIVKLNQVYTCQQAEQFKNMFFCVSKKLFCSYKGEEIYLVEVLNFEVEDQTRGSLGKVSGFLDNGVQDLLLVKNLQGRDVEIPFIKEFIIHIDFELKKIQVNLSLNWPNLEDKECQ